MNTIQKELNKTSVHLVINGETVSETLMNENCNILSNFFIENGFEKSINTIDDFYFFLDNFFNISIPEEYATIENLSYIYSLVKIHEDKAISLLKTKGINIFHNLEVISSMCNSEFLGIFTSKESFFNSLNSENFSHENSFLFAEYNQQFYIFNNDFEKYEYGYDDLKRERDYDMAQMGMVWCYESKEYI